jgi:hypothetical protein
MTKEEVDKLARSIDKHVEKMETCMQLLIGEVNGDMQQMDYGLQLDRALVEIELVLAVVRRKLEEERSK